MNHFKENIPGILAIGFTLLFFVAYLLMIISPQYKNADIIIVLSNLEALIIGKYFMRHKEPNK